MKNKLKQITIMGEIWDFWNVLKIHDSIFDSHYISIYPPWLKGDINKDNIYSLGEKSKNKLMWIYKIIRRNLYFIKKISNLKPDIVITHHDDANISIIPSIIYFKYILRKRNIKFVAYIHNGNYNIDSSLNKLILFCIKNLYKFFDQIITVSKGNKIMLENKFGLKNIEYVYNPIDIERSIKLSGELDEEYKKIKNRIKNKKIFLNIGRLTYQKGQEELIYGFSEIQKNTPNIILIIIGIGELEESLKLLSKKLGVQNNIIFLGKQNNVFQYMNICDFFILPSIWESFGQVLAEILPFNKIIISTDCKSGPREILSPDITLKEKINYPFFAKHGILINNNRKNISDIMGYCILNHKYLKNKYKDTISHGISFDKTNIQLEYKKIYDKLITGTI